MSKAKILLLDIETFAMRVNAWGLYDQNIGLNQIHKDWSIASWAAKWLGDPKHKIMYQDVSKQKNKRDDSKILKKMWKLLDEADVIISQNGKKFDLPKLKARFAINGFKPFSDFQHIDTRQLAKREFGFTSNSLEYLGQALNIKHKKLKHKKFPGMELWDECLKGNKQAWEEMKKYNQHDVFALEDIYNKLIPWHNPVDFRVYSDGTKAVCPTCSSPRMQKYGIRTTKTGQYRRYRCHDCGTYTADKGQKNNLLSKKKQESLKRGG